MTTIISRLYPDTATARAVHAALTGAGQRPETLSLITADGAETAAEQMAAARLTKSAAAAYGAALTAGRALIVVRAPFNPIGTALEATRIVDSVPSLRVGLVSEDVTAKDPLMPGMLSILSDHPRFLTQDMDHPAARRGPVSLAFGLRLLSPDRKKTSAMRGGGYLSTKLLPFPLIIHSRKRTSAMQNGGTPLSSMLGLPTISHRS